MIAEVLGGAGTVGTLALGWYTIRLSKHAASITEAAHETAAQKAAELDKLRFYQQATETAQDVMQRTITGLKTELERMQKEVDKLRDEAMHDHAVQADMAATIDRLERLVRKMQLRLETAGLEVPVI